MTPVLTHLDEPAQDSDGSNPETSQLNLFPISKLHVVPRNQTNRRPIKLPRSVLTIAPTEQLSDYLSRVAGAAMRAATTSYGSARQAAVRLGTADEDQERSSTTRTVLALAPEPSEPQT